MSTIRGWVYLMTNPALPGLVKIGFSTKDPKLRLTQLSGTGVPYPYELCFDVLVIEPREVEQLVHKELLNHKESKEFFRVSLGQAISTIEWVLRDLDREPIAINYWNTEERHLAGEAPYQPYVGTCRICGVKYRRNQSRCDKCFALLSDEGDPAA